MKPVLRIMIVIFVYVAFMSHRINARENIDSILVNDKRPEREATVFLQKKYDSLVKSYQKDSSDMNTLKSIIPLAYQLEKETETVKYAEEFMHMAQASGSEAEVMVSYIYYAQVKLIYSDYDESKEYLDKAVSIYERIVEKGADGIKDCIDEILMMYNCLNIYNVEYLMDYRQGVEYLIQGLNLSARYGVDNFDTDILYHNLMLDMFYIGSPNGFDYAQELYDRAKKSNDKAKISLGASGLSMKYFLEKKYDLAERFMLEDLSLSDSYSIKVLMWKYNLYANILRMMGRREEAERYYHKALDFYGTESVPTEIYTLYSYGDFLREQKRYEKSERILLKALDDSRIKNNNIFKTRIYYSLYLLYNERKQWEKALEYYVMFSNDESKIFSLQQERELNRLTMEHESYKHKVELERKDNNMKFLALLNTVIIGILVYIFIQYRSKNRRYMRIALQYREVLDNEMRYKDRINALKTENAELREEMKGIGEARKISITEDAKTIMIHRLETLMEKDKIYRDPTLSREKLTDILQTNRTYLSEVVNGYYGKSINQLINSYRINEAVDILSEVKCDMPMKAIESKIGFSSSSTFFKSFREQVGMSPSKYREMILHSYKMS